jgi:hypothetical protein
MAGGRAVIATRRAVIAGGRAVIATRRAVIAVGPAVIEGGRDGRDAKRANREVGFDGISRRRASLAGSGAPPGRKVTFRVGRARPPASPAPLRGIRSQADDENGEITSERATFLAITARFAGRSDGLPTSPSGLSRKKVKSSPNQRHSLLELVVYRLDRRPPSPSIAQCRRRRAT